VNNTGPFPFAEESHRGFAPFGAGNLEGECRRLLLRRASAGATNNMMNKAIVTYTGLDEMKAEEFREWRALPAHERLRAAAELTLAAYRMKEPAQDVRRIQRTLVHLRRPKR